MIPIVPMQAIVTESAVKRAMVDVAEKYPDYVNVARYLVREKQNAVSIAKLLKDDGVPFAYAVAAVKVAGDRF